MVDKNEVLWDLYLSNFTDANGKAISFGHEAKIKNQLELLLPTGQGHDILAATNSKMKMTDVYDTLNRVHDTLQLSAIEMNILDKIIADVKELAC